MATLGLLSLTTICIVLALVFSSGGASASHPYSMNCPPTIPCSSNIAHTSFGRCVDGRFSQPLSNAGIPSMKPRTVISATLKDPRAGQRSSRRSFDNFRAAYFSHSPPRKIYETDPYAFLSTFAVPALPFSPDRHALVKLHHSRVPLTGYSLATRNVPLRAAARISWLNWAPSDAHPSLRKDSTSAVCYRAPGRDTSLRVSRLSAIRAKDGSGKPARVDATGAATGAANFPKRLPSFLQRMAAAAMYLVPNLELLQTFLPSLTTMLPCVAPLWVFAAKCVELYSRVPCASLLSFGAPYTLLIKKRELFKPSYFLRHHTMTALILSMLQYTLSMIYFKGISASRTASGTTHETIVLSLFLVAQTLLLSSMLSAIGAKYAWVPVVTEAVGMHIGEKPPGSY